MRKNIFAPSLFVLLLLAAGALGVMAGSLSAQSLAARPIADVGKEARALFAEQSYALAQPLFKEWRERAVVGSAEALEARFFELFCESKTVRSRSLSSAEEEALQMRRGAEASEIARQLRAMGSQAAPAWLRVAEAGIDWDRGRPEDWDPLSNILRFWGQSTDLDTARSEYLRILWAATQGGRNFYAFRAPDRRLFLRHAARMAQTPEDISRFNLLLAQIYGHWQTDDTEGPIRRGEALERAVRAGPETRGYAESLWELAQWAERYGTAYYNEDGERAFMPDYVRTKAAYEALLQTTREEWSRWRERASEAIARLERPDLQVLVSHAFRPETEIVFNLRWRNLEAPSVEVYKFDATSEGYLDWIQSAQPPPPASAEDIVYTAKVTGEPSGLHFPTLQTVRLERDLPPAAYVVVARSGDKVDWAPLFVTNLVLVTHRFGDAVVVFAADADLGKPRVGLSLAAEFMVQAPDPGQAPFKARVTGTSDQDGLWTFQRPQLPEGRLRWSITAQAEERHGATALSGIDWRGMERPTEREAYLITDRSLYRPGDPVEVAGWLRQRTEGEWLLPDLSQEFNYRVHSGRNEWEESGSLQLNQNGSFTLKLALPDTAPLGTYRIEILDQEGRWQTPYQFFRVEEYRTPEIEARIALGAGSPLQPGDDIEGRVEVDYYAGGAVEEATVELVVTRQPYRPDFSPSFDEPWFFEHAGARFSPPSAEEVLRLELMTDARGAATFSIPTERDAETDWTYTVEARIRDLSRRETTTRRDVKVTRQAYFASLELEHRLIAPEDRTQLVIRLEDANGSPVEDSGEVRVVRERWREIYVHRRRGSEISGESYRELPDRSMISAARSDYRLRDSGFVTEQVDRFEIETNAMGLAVLNYEPSEEGYYKFEWLSRGDRGKPVRAEVPLWVSNDATSEIGYRPGGIQLIADAGPHAVGEPISVLITAPVANRWVLLSVSARGLLEQRVVRLEGSSRLIRIESDPRMQPNCFVDVSLVSDESHFMDTLELILPPRQQYLDVSLEPDREGYEPGDAASVRIQVRDADGLPVQTDLVFGASDAALYSIEKDRREPVRKYFYGDKNRRILQIASSLEGRPFFKPLEADAEESPLVYGDEEVFELSAFALGTVEASGMTRSSTAGLMLQDNLSREKGFTPILRRNFQSTLHWSPMLRTDEQGQAEVNFTFPDNLTAWKMQVVAIDTDTRVGEASSRTTTRLPLITRLQMPRFLTERDSAIVSGIVQNNTQREIYVTPELNVEGPLSAKGDDDVTLAVRPGTTARADWSVEADRAGAAVLRLSAATALLGDAVERPLLVVPHGVGKTVGLMGQSSADSIRLNLGLPSIADRDDTRVHLELSTSLAPQLLGALPYLIDFPYGCTEQTISRFLPALVVRRNAEKLGQPLEVIDTAMFASLSPEVRGERRDMRGVLEAVTEASLSRLADMQLPDGSFPWMPGGSSDVYMTAYAVWTLTLAEEVGQDVTVLRLPEARAWLERALIERDLSPADQTWALLALASRYRAEVFGRPSRMEARVFLDLMGERDRLTSMSLAMLALAAQYYGFDEDTGVLLNNLANGVQLGEGTLEGATDAEGRLLRLPMAHWGASNGYFSWAEGSVESTAWVLSALLTIDDEHPWVNPAVNWLSRNRTGTHWENTRATAFAILALTDYLSRNAETLREATFSVVVDGEPLVPEGSPTWTSTEWVPLHIPLPPNSTDGYSTVVEVERKDAEDAFHFGLYAEYFDRSEDILAASSDVAIQRDYWHLKPLATLLEGVREVMTPLLNGGTVVSGDRVEVVLRLEVPRELRYVLIEDLKPAGLEAVQLLSGPTAVARELAARTQATELGRSVYSERALQGHQELRDRKVAFLFERLPAGSWEIRYRLRAESPGRFHALPATIGPMYLPHVRGNSAEWKLQVRDGE